MAGPYDSYTLDARQRAAQGMMAPKGKSEKADDIGGYIGGGMDQFSTNLTWTNKFAFSDDSRTTLGTGLSAARRMVGGMANSGTAGYFGGGYTASVYVSTVDKFAFSDDSRTTLGTGLSSARYSLGAMANSETLA